MSPSMLSRLSAVRAAPRPRPVALAVLVIAVALALDVAIFLDPLDLLATTLDPTIAAAAIAIETAVAVLMIHPLVGMGFDLVRAWVRLPSSGAAQVGDGGIGFGIWEYHVFGSDHGSGGDGGGDGGGGDGGGGDGGGGGGD